MNINTQHRHGGNPAADFARMGLDFRDVIDFSVNLNPMGVPSVISGNWNGLINEVQNYPDIEGSGITHYYSEKTGISPENILPGNGSTELIYLIPRVFGFRRAVIIIPSFNDYTRACMLAGAEIETLQLEPETSFDLPAVNVLENSIKDADALWLGRPNNPTANLFSRKIILDMVLKYPEKMFIVDEAFIQFADNWTTETLMHETHISNLLVLHSMTKFYAVAGLRMGGVIGRSDTIRRLRDAKEPWTVNGIADRAAILLEQCEDYDKETILLNSRERGRIYEILSGIPGISVFPSSANFFLCRWDRTDNLDDLIGYLLRNGVYIRDCRNFQGLDGSFFRFGIRSQKDNDRLVSLLSSFTA